MADKKSQRTMAVFDLDNTLIDSQAKLTADFVAAMQRLRIQMTPEEIKAGKWYETAQKYGFSKEAFDKAFDQRKTWEKSLADGEVPLFSDTIPCLEELASNGVRMAVLSKSIPKYTQTKLDYHNLNRYFERVVTVDPKAPTKKYGALYLLSEMNPEQIRGASFIGDKSEDVAIAKDIEEDYYLPCRGFYLNRTGSRMPEELRGAGISAITSLRELTPYLLQEDIS